VYVLVIKSASLKVLSTAQTTQFSLGFLLDRSCNFQKRDVFLKTRAYHREMNASDPSFSIPSYRIFGLRCQKYDIVNFASRRDLKTCLRFCKLVRGDQIVSPNLQHYYKRHSLCAFHCENGSCQELCEILLEISTEFTFKT
jgi:hypothetical protein